MKIEMVEKRPSIDGKGIIRPWDPYESLARMLTDSFSVESSLSAPSIYLKMINMGDVTGAGHVGNRTGGGANQPISVWA